ncbi:MAG: EI24 domain-containing protein [Oscillatoriales cyanobacterium C42_A2020_001]|nr:EI24 domain-containing protein [Leptolyngbyaceae cyanobacterium C42_A2020_001]
MTQRSEPDDFQGIIHWPGDFVAGALYPIRAIALFQRSPRLLAYVIVPIIVNLVLGVALYIGLLLPSWEAITHWSSGLPEGVKVWIAELPVWAHRWLGWLPPSVAVLDDVARWILAAALFVTLGLLLVQFGAIAGAPWYGALAEQVEHAYTGQLPVVSMTPARAIQDIGRAIAFQFKKLLLLGGFGILLLLFNFLPPIGPLLASVGWLTLAGVLVFLDFIDPPLERRRLRFRTKLSLVTRTFPASATFGYMSLWLVSIPLLNLVTVPLCVVAGTLFCCNYALPSLKDEANS